MLLKIIIIYGNKKRGFDNFASINSKIRKNADLKDNSILQRLNVIKSIYHSFASSLFIQVKTVTCMI